MTTYLFDIDGTLTPSRQPMVEHFARDFLSWTKQNDVYLVTGSDYDKVVEQIPKNIRMAVKGIHSCMGNTYYEKDDLKYIKDFSYPNSLVSFLEDELDLCPYPWRAGKHIEFRTGMINFSIVGRAANLAERAMFFSCDNVLHERERIASRIRNRFPDIDATVAGETGIDIYPKGQDKSQVIKRVQGDIVFFGDRTLPGGNDHGAAVEVRKQGGKVWQVSGWQHTHDIISEHYS